MTAKKELKMNPAEKKSQQDTADWNKNKHKNINDSNGIRNGNLQVTTDTLNTLNIKFKGSYTPRCTLKKGWNQFERSLNRSRPIRQIRYTLALQTYIIY